MVRLCGASLALFAFALTVILGLATGNSAEAILQRGLLALFIFCALGMLVGWIGTRVLDEHAVHRQKELFSAIETKDQNAASENDMRQSADSAGVDGGGTKPAAI